MSHTTISRAALHSLRRSLPITLVLAVGALLSGCGSKNPSGPQTGPNQPPPEVTVETLTSGPIRVTAELPGRLEPIRTAEVRARVSGILLKKAYREGSDVKEGELLFLIDPAPLEATRNSAKANVVKAEANLKLAEVQEARFRKLVSGNAVSQQEHDAAIAAADVARAELGVAHSVLKTAELNLSYATVEAPISGFVGGADVTEGALVGQGEATRMAVIQQIDTIYFDFTQSSTEWLRLRRAVKEGRFQGLNAAEAKVSLLLEDGTVYQHPGRLLFSDVSVDLSTGNVTLRAEFPNPDRILLPGMFARVKVEQAVDENAVTVPQQAVIRDVTGSSTAFVVTPENTIEPRKVELGSAMDNRWVVLSGLKSGERVVMEGHMKVAPGTVVTPVPFAAEVPAAAAAQSK